MKWLIEPEVFGNDCKIEDALKKLNVEYIVAKFGTPYENYLTAFSEDDKVVFHGSYQFAKLIQKNTNWIVYCDTSKFECSYYYPKFGNNLLNENYVMLPFGDLYRRKDWLFQTMGKEIFLKPNSFKSFTGMVIPESILSQPYL